MNKYAGLVLGSGTHYMPGWLNVDIAAEDADLKLDVLLGLPGEWTSQFDKIYLGHICEHLPYDKVPEVLRECERVCRDGGQVVVVGPAMDRAIATGQPQWLLDAIEGKPAEDHSGAGHLWTADSENTMDAVRKVFPDAQEIPLAETMRPSWPNRVADNWQIAIRATVTKPDHQYEYIRGRV